MLSGFSGKIVYGNCPVARRLPVLSGSVIQTDLPVCLMPTPFNVLFRQYAFLSLFRPRVAV